MLSALRIARIARPQRLAATAVKTTSLRFLSSSKVVASDAAPPQLYGPGAKDVNRIPTDEEQATGLERFQLLGQMEGIDVFDMTPLDSSRIGTVADPIKVRSLVRAEMFTC